MVWDIADPSQVDNVIESGKSWEIQCSGDFPVQWIYPSPKDNENNGGPNIDHRVNISDWEVPNSEIGAFYSKLRLNQAHYLDTGPFLCQYQDTEEIRRLKAEDVSEGFPFFAAE